MRLRETSLLLLFLVGGLTLSLSHGQDPAQPGTPRPTRQPVVIPSAIVTPGKAAASATGQTVPASKAASEQAPLSGLQQQMVLATHRGTDWLAGMNGTTGRFLHGWVPSLATPVEGDNYLRQAGAAMILARAARYTRNERAGVLATHAVLVLFDETVTDPQDSQVRYTTLPSIVINRLGAAALLVLAVHELPAPPKDLLEKAEQLCNYIAKQARPDGSLSCGDLQADGKPGPEESDAVLHYPGSALYALMRSQKRCPAAWKIEVVRKAVAYYHPWWRKNKAMAFVPWQTAAYVEAYLQTHDRAFADCVYEMNDWLCGLQYDQLDPAHHLWMGGFLSWMDGKPVQTPPQIHSAQWIESLAQAARITREPPVDVARNKRYMEALEHGLQFVSTLQYTEGNTQYFEESYRSRLVGGFHFSHQDGQLRIDYTQMALAALITYLEQAAP